MPSVDTAIWARTERLKPAGQCPAYEVADEVLKVGGRKGSKTIGHNLL